MQIPSNAPRLFFDNGPGNRYDGGRIYVLSPGKGVFSMTPNRPSMVLFDYGQNLIDEPYFDKELGMAAVLSHADANPLGRTARELADYVDALEAEMERFRAADGHIPLYETHNLPFQRYVFASQGLSFSLPGEELETLYWDAAAPGRPTEGIAELLDLLAAGGHPHRRHQQPLLLRRRPPGPTGPAAARPPLRVRPGHQRIRLPQAQPPDLPAGPHHGGTGAP